MTPPNRPALPERGEVERWLRENIAPRPASRIARWLGWTQPFSYVVGDPVGWELEFFQKHSLFRVFGERALLPFPTLPSGSWGVFWTNGQKLSLLRPQSDTLPELFLAEGRALVEGEPQSLAELICEIELRSGAHHHVVVANPEAVRAYHPDRAPGEYAVDERELERIGAELLAPRIEARPEGWRLTFSSLFGWMHDLQDLGIERIDVARDFRITRHARERLSRRIFTAVPMVRY